MCIIGFWGFCLLSTCKTNVFIMVWNVLTYPRCWLMSSSHRLFLNLAYLTPLLPIVQNSIRVWWAKHFENFNVEFPSTYYSQHWRVCFFANNAVSLIVAFLCEPFDFVNKNGLISERPQWKKWQLFVPACNFRVGGSCWFLHPILFQRYLQKVLRCKQRTQSRHLEKIFVVQVSNAPCE